MSSEPSTIERPALGQLHEFTLQVSSTMQRLNDMKSKVILPYVGAFNVVTKYDSTPDVPEGRGVLTGMYYSMLGLPGNELLDVCLVCEDEQPLELMVFQRSIQHLISFRQAAGMMTDERPDVGLLVHWLGMTNDPHTDQELARYNMVHGLGIRLQEVVDETVVRSA